MTSLSFHSAVVLTYAPLAFLSFRRCTLEPSAKLIILSFLLTFLIRAASAGLLLDEGFRSHKTSLTVILDILVSAAATIIYLSLYYLTFEMHATKIIVHSLTFETFRLRIRQLKVTRGVILSLVFFVQGSIAIVVQIKAQKRVDGGKWEYPAWFRGVNLCIRLLKVVMDFYILALFFLLLQYFT